MINPQNGWSMTHDHRAGTGILCASYSNPCQSTKVQYDTNKQMKQENIIDSFPGAKIVSHDNNCKNASIHQGQLCVTRSTTDDFEININVSTHNDMNHRIIYDIRPIGYGN